MDKYKIVMELNDVSSTRDIDREIFRDYVTDTFVRVVDTAHKHGFDLLSLYLIKATDCAPFDGGDLNENVSS